MCGGAGCGRVIGLVFLFIAAAACVIHFVAPFWLYIEGLTASMGLWGYCGGDGMDLSNIGDTLDGCTWFSQDDFAWEKNVLD